MALFNLNKKAAKAKMPTCCCGNTKPKAEDTRAYCYDSGPRAEEAASCCCVKPVEGICCVKVLGSGCKSCHAQYEYVKKAIRNLSLDIVVEYITDLETIMEYGVISMPAIVINDKVSAFGKVMKTAEIEKLFTDLLL